jgi:hypothetical protein
MVLNEGAWLILKIHYKFTTFRSLGRHYKFSNNLNEKNKKFRDKSTSLVSREEWVTE